MLIVLSGVFMFQEFVLGQNKRSSALFEGRSSAQSAIRSLTDDIRQAQQLSDSTPALALADSNEITMYTCVDASGPVERVHYVINGTNLVRGLSRSTTANPDVFGTETTMIISRTLANSTTVPLFRYFSSNTTESGTLPLSLENRLDVRLIRINPVVDTGSGNVDLSTDVFLRNSPPL